MWEEKKCLRDYKNGQEFLDALELKRAEKAFIDALSKAITEQIYDEGMPHLMFGRDEYEDEDEEKDK